MTVDIEAPFRAATPDDAEALVDLIDFAGDGLPSFLWGRMAEADETARDVGLRRARHEKGSFSYRNVVVFEEAGRCAACLIGYVLPDAIQMIDETLPATFVPMQQLENLVPGTWYVNVLAAYPEFRGKGIGARLLRLAETLANDAGCRALSIIVSDANTGARRLYERCGYSQAAALPMVEDGWANPGANWVLLTKSL